MEFTTTTKPASCQPRIRVILLTGNPSCEWRSSQISITLR